MSSAGVDRTASDAGDLALLVGIPAFLLQVGFTVALWIPGVNDGFVTLAAITLGCCGLCLLGPLGNLGALIAGLVSVVKKEGTWRGPVSLLLGLVGTGLVVLDAWLVLAWI